MLFTEARFFAFFGVVFAVHWALSSNRARKLWLLGASYLFYAAWDWRFLSLILASTAVDYVAGRAMEGAGPAGRRASLTVAVAVNLAILGFFKYWGFFVDSAEGLLSALGFEIGPRTFSVVLPVGISFFTFQSMSYTIDVYRGRMSPVRRFSDFALFVGFFPQLVAGPIVRAASFLPQLEAPRRFASVDAQRCLALFLQGFVKKACVADQLSRAVDPVFADPAAYDATSRWLASLTYHVQIYCDFSGYTDMAIAAAGLLGYRLARNFDFPYLALSVRDFWRRWHVSLSTWFRDYLYLSLGGNRGGAWRTRRNLVLVFLLCGLWHGAAWTFVLWGAWHGALLLLERTRAGGLLDRLPALLRALYVQLAVVLAWVLFRSPDLATAGDFLRGMLGLGLGAEAAASALPWQWGLAVLGFALVHAASRRVRPLERVGALPAWAFAVGYGAAWALALPWVAVDRQPFIYFQF
jgi:alginate O-acetyltransferase complex protein AlgI